ncbi:MAG: NAD(+)--dinitrogen-reductase ADP-D-ribosyltransferase [Proteobacteria bacterium]|nr:NAD(+)--dinitrogen-reductase ADP-D-ribosyltransferase [Pseudomonadota bacterium]
MNQNHITSLNLVGCPTSYFASPAFNQNPLPISINGVRQMNHQLFSTMDKFDEKDAPLLFMEHMRVMFELDVDVEIQEKIQRPISYLRMLRGWFFDSNRPEGAVVKGWVESRFGLKTLFHKKKLGSITDVPYLRYLSERMHRRFHSNSIYAQFDLLYEYSQYYWNRFGPPQNKLVLYRGINNLHSELQVVEELGKRKLIIRNNCVNSYSSSKERASEFGDTIIKISLPIQKIFCSPEILPGKLPNYENEYLILGGDYLSEIVDLF